VGVIPLKATGHVRIAASAACTSISKLNARLPSRTPGHRISVSEIQTGLCISTPTRDTALGFLLFLSQTHRRTSPPLVERNAKLLPLADHAGKKEPEPSAAPSVRFHDRLYSESKSQMSALSNPFMRSRMWNFEVDLPRIRRNASSLPSGEGTTSPKASIRNMSDGSRRRGSPRNCSIKARTMSHRKHIPIDPMVAPQAQSIQPATQDPSG
jgi:hypothetical protein